MNSQLDRQTKVYRTLARTFRQLIDKLRFIGDYWPMRLTLIALLFVIAITSPGLTASTPLVQDEKPPAVCKPDALRAVRPIPQLRYRCRPNVNEYDEAILKWPERVRAVSALSAQLKMLTQAAWWDADVEDLNACSFKKRAGKFTKEQDEQYRSNYAINLLGNSNARVIVVSDPCYQTGYSGSVLFLVARNSPTNVVTKALDGYFTRVDNSVTFDWADLPDEQIVEIGTGNSMPPSLEKLYFSVDKKTHRIEPKKLFKDGGQFSNKIYSDMLLSDPAEAGLPDDAAELVVIKDHKLASAFSTYSEDTDGKIEANGKHFNRTIFRWNGRYFEPAQ